MNRQFYEECVASGKRHVEAMRSALRETRKSMEWHKRQMKALREQEQRHREYVAEAEQLLAEKEGWLADYDAQHPDEVEGRLRANVAASQEG